MFTNDKYLPSLIANAPTRKFSCGCGYEFEVLPGGYDAAAIDPISQEVLYLMHCPKCGHEFHVREDVERIFKI